MKVNVAQLMKSAVGSTREYDLEEAFDEIDGQSLTRPVHVHVHLTRINEGLLARGDLTTTIETVCSRCVEPAEQAIAYHFEEQFRPTIDIATGLPVKELDVTDGEFTIDANHVMDIDEVIREGIVIETPMHPLCSPGCRGLCPKCGKNLNQGPCGCEPDEPSGPLAAMLKGLVPLIERQD